METAEAIIKKDEIYNVSFKEFESTNEKRVSFIVNDLYELKDVLRLLFHIGYNNIIVTSLKKVEIK